MNSSSRIVGDGFFLVEKRIFEILRELKKQQEKAKDLKKSGNYDPLKHSIDLEYVIEDVERLRKSIHSLREWVSKER